MKCARDRLLEILAERSAMRLAIPASERPMFIVTHVSEWRAALSAEYGGEPVRITTQKVPRETRAARNQRIVESLQAGQPAKEIAQRERVSVAMVKQIRAKAKTLHCF